MSVTLRWHYDGVSKLPPAAIFVLGEGPAEWLAALSNWQVPLAALSLFVIPESRSDLRPRGVLIPVPEGVPFPKIPGAQAYGQLGSKLYCPVEASVSPPVAPEEWRTLLASSYAAYVWHPQTGLIAIEVEDVLRVSDLLKLPPIDEVDWSYAEPGTAINTRLVSIEAPWPESSQEVLAEGADGIGSKAEQLPKPSPNLGQTLGGAAKLGAGMAALPFAWMASKLANMAPRTAGEPTWIDNVANWADGVLQAGANLLNARAKELDRLMKMLNDSPDEGLQYAIPIGGGDGPSRPVAPTGQLQRRPADFSLGRLFGGGGATDYWDIPADLQFQLLQRYRELAEREVRLGRYRRAAYIYGELLNDLNSAASTLVKGGHYREAAVLYRDRLHRPLEAAQCLEQGGLLHEAIAIYETLERYETVGDLYSELEEDELAEEAYRKHVEACKQRGDFLAATKALDEKLHVPEEALVLVKENWRNSSLRRECLLKSFELMGRLGRHDEATEQVQLLRGGLFPSNLTMPVVEGLSEVALTYPEREVCDRAEDATRVVVSKAVIEEQGLNSQLFQILEKLTPEDRLLPRDTKRYLRPKPVKLTRSPSISRRPPPNRGKANTVIAHIKKRGRLPGSVEWRCLETSRDAFHALGTSPRSEGMLGSGKPGGVMLASGQLEDLTRDHVIRWPERETEGRPVLMAVDEADRTTTIHILANTLTIQEPQDSIDRQIIAGTPGWLKANTFGLASCSGVTWAVEIPEFSLKGFDRSGVPLANRQLLPPQDMVFHTLEGERSIVPMHAREEMVYIGLGALLYSVSRKNDLRQIDVGGQILSIVGSQKYTRPRIAAFFEYGGVVVWPSLGEGLVTALSGELIHPQGVFLRDGALVIYSESGWQMYETARGRLTWKGDIEGITLTPTGLFSTRNPNELGVWNEDGTIVIYSLSR